MLLVVILVVITPSVEASSKVPDPKDLSASLMDFGLHRWNEFVVTDSEVGLGPEETVWWKSSARLDTSKNSHLIQDVADRKDKRKRGDSSSSGVAQGKKKQRAISPVPADAYGLDVTRGTDTHIPGEKSLGKRRAVEIDGMKTAEQGFVTGDNVAAFQSVNNTFPALKEAIPPSYAKILPIICI